MKTSASRSSTRRKRTTHARRAPKARRNGERRGAAPPATIETLLGREWMVTNGLGGYSSGTLLNVPTRRFHALLVSALPAPLGRVVMLNQLTERITLPDGRSGEIGGSELG